MSELIGGISLDEINAASDDFLDDEASEVSQEPVAVKKTVSSTAIGGIELDAIMAASDFDDDLDAVVTAPQPQSTVAKATVQPQVTEQPQTVVQPQVAVQPQAVVQPQVAVQAQPVVQPQVTAQTQTVVPLQSQTAQPGLSDDTRKHELSIADDTREEKAKTDSFIKKTSLGAVFAEVIERKNVGLIMWLILNLLLGGGLIVVVFALYGMPILAAIAFALFLYLVKLASMYTKSGDKSIRKSFGLIPWADVKLIEPDADWYGIQSAFNEVYDKARQKAPNIEDVELFLFDDPSVNAFAVGKRTVAVTRGMLQMPTSQVKAVLGHEFGHLAHRDTEILLIPQAGNFLFTGLVKFVCFIFKIYAVIIDFFNMIINDADKTTGLNIVRKIEWFFTDKLLGWWMSLGTLICTKNNKENEFAADRFSCDLGYGEKLKEAFLTMEDGSEMHGYFATLISTHPATPERVMEINEYLMAQN